MAAVGLSLSLWEYKLLILYFCDIFIIISSISIIINIIISIIIIIIIISMIKLTLNAATILLVMCALVGICFKISSSEGATA